MLCSSSASSATGLVWRRGVSDKVKYPLPCGCASEKYITMCDKHQIEIRIAHSRLMGVADFHYVAADILSLDKSQRVLAEIRFRLTEHPDKPFLVKIIP
jgi:hypothetical protein